MNDVLLWIAAIALIVLPLSALEIRDCLRKKKTARANAVDDARGCEKKLKRR